MTELIERRLEHEQSQGRNYHESVLRQFPHMKDWPQRATEVRVGDWLEIPGSVFETWAGTNVERSSEESFSNNPITVRVVEITRKQRDTQGRILTLEDPYSLDRVVVEGEADGKKLKKSVDASLWYNCGIAHTN